MGSFLETFYDPVRVTHLAVSSFIDSKVTLLAEPAFLYINTLACPAGLTRTWLDNQSMRECCC